MYKVNAPRALKKLATARYGFIGRKHLPEHIPEVERRIGRKVHYVGWRIALARDGTEAETSYLDTMLAGVAMETAAHALDWALYGDAALDAAHWLYVTRAEVLEAPDLEAAIKAEDVPGDDARTLARRIHLLVERAPLPHDIPGGQWLGIAGAAGVPERERPVLLVLARLALNVTNALAPPDASGRLVMAPLIDSVTEPGTYWDGEGPWAGILATRLGVAGLLEREHLELLGLGAHALIDGHAGFDDWIPRGSDPTVQVRIPVEHRGVPLAFAPFVATRQDALDALGDGPLFGEVLSHIADAFHALSEAKHHNPQRPAALSVRFHPGRTGSAPTCP